ncbi:MAG: hypothetical protein AB7E04_01825 [Desulfobacteraceae bacterium]
MEINWKILKKRGYFRPVLTYSIKLSKEECGLGISSLKIDTKILKPLNSWESHCFPDKNERAGLFDSKTYEISSPSFKNSVINGSFVLCWKEDNLYPEVKKGFEIVRNVMENEIVKAQESLPISESGEIFISSAFRKKTAPGFAAERFLNACGM